MPSSHILIKAQKQGDLPIYATAATNKIPRPSTNPILEKLPLRLSGKPTPLVSAVYLARVCTQDSPRLPLVVAARRYYNEQNRCQIRL